MKYDYICSDLWVDETNGILFMLRMIWYVATCRTHYYCLSLKKFLQVKSVLKFKSSYVASTREARPCSLKHRRLERFLIVRDNYSLFGGLYPYLLDISGSSGIYGTRIPNTQHTAHSTQHTAHSTQHKARAKIGHSTQHTAHSTQHTAHSTQHTAHS